MSSIGKRIYRATALVSVISLITMFIITAWVSEDLESTMLKVEMANERDFFLAQQFDADKPVHRQFSGLTLIYLPKGYQNLSTDDEQSEVAMIFKGLKPPFSGEVTIKDETYLVSIHQMENGSLYLGRNITHFERREWMFRLAMLSAIALIALLIGVLAVISAKRVVKPLRDLSDQIQAMPVGSRMARLPIAWHDEELQTIAKAFNEFVGQLEAFVRREKSLLNLASHELRTPLAVVSGALDILDQRGNLSHADQTTVERIRRATEEMQSNISILLALARKDQENNLDTAPVSISSEIQRVLDDLSGTFPVQSRVDLRAFSPGQVKAEASMVRMLLRNLVQNALQHTQRRVSITVHADYFDVRDEGPGLSRQAQDILDSRVTLGQEEGPVHGLGLYLVTLMVERLGWSLHIVETSSRGTVLRVFYGHA